MASVKRTFYPELESLRGVAALFVVIFHVYASEIPNAATLSHPTFTNITNLVITTVFGGTGAVTLFFVLSGYVLAQSLNRVDSLTPRTYFAFVIKRLFRLMPAAWASLILAAALIHFYYRVPMPSNLWRAALLDVDAVQPLNGPLWSLHVELWASLCFPFLVMFNRLLSPLFQIGMLALLYNISATYGYPYFTVFLFCFQFGIMVPSIFLPAFARMSQRASTLLFFCAVAAVLVPTNISNMGLLGVKEHTHIEGLGAALVVAYLLSERGVWLSDLLNIPILRKPIVECLRFGL